MAGFNPLIVSDLCDVQEDTLAVEDSTITPLRPPQRINFQEAGVVRDSGKLCVTQEDTVKTVQTEPVLQCEHRHCTSMYCTVLYINVLYCTVQVLHFNVRYNNVRWAYRQREQCHITHITYFQATTEEICKASSDTCYPVLTLY